MSWERFKETILRVANNPESIPDRNTVAKLYANAYDTAIKNGSDVNHKTPLIKGNVESMRIAFLAALEKGVTTNGPYDLVAEMGAGVKEYWRNATMATLPTPIQLPKGAIANINILGNTITDVGVWLEPLVTPSPPKPANTPPPPPTQKPKPADDYNLRKMLDDAGYAAIKKYEDENGCVALIGGRTGLQLTDYKQVGCVGYNPGMDTQEQTIKERIKNVLGFDVWAKIPPVFRMQIYSFMYNADSRASVDLFRWIAGLLQAAKNETAQYRKSVRENKTIRDVEVSYLKTLTTTDFQKIYPTYLKVLDEMYKAISDAELQSAANKTTNSDKAGAIRLGAAYNLTWKDRPSKIQEFYNSSLLGKKDKIPQEVGQTTEPPKQTTEEPTSNTPLKSGPIPPTNDTSLFVDYFIRTAIDHLNTIKGIIITQSSYGIINGPGVLNWTGYRVVGTTIRRIVSVDDFSDKLKDYLKSQGVVETEEIIDETADEKGDGDAITYTKYKGGNQKQKNAMASALLAVHKIGTYIDYKVFPKGKNNYSVGFDVGLCAQWTFNIAKNYVFYLKGFGSKSDANAYRAGANANESGYWTSLKYLGYTLDIDTTFKTKAPLIAVLSDFEKFNIGDVVVYYGTDGIELPGHTQIFTGGYGSDYPKAAYGTPAPNRPKKKYLEKGGWDNVSNWETDAYNNYGSPMVYRSKKNTSTTWRLLIFRAPSK